TIGRRRFLATIAGLLVAPPLRRVSASTQAPAVVQTPRTRRLIDQDWRFIKDDPPRDDVSLLYDLRPQAAARGAAPPPVPEVPIVKSWIRPSGNAFVNDPAKRVRRPDDNLDDRVSYSAANFDDSSWRSVNLPHDYAIEGPFLTTGGGGMGRLPSAGVVWYR